MKQCYRCKVNKDLSEFSKNVAKSDRLSDQCKSCHKILRKEHYTKNKSKILLQVKQTKENYFEWYKSLKNKPCKDCGIKYPYYVMEFDHSHSKKFQLGSAAKGHYSKQEVLNEISKCELVCANCHRVRTHLRWEKNKI